MIVEIRNRFPGIGCAYADAAGKEAAGYFGVSDKEKNIPVDEHTVFPACSISKFVTAICLMKLHEHKIIDIDAPVNDYLQQWKLLTARETISDASIRALMSHTAGIVDGDDSFYGLRRDDPEICLQDILEGRTFYNNRPVRAEKPQGAEFAYSDAGYCILQLLIQQATHKAFDAAAKALIFDSLDLHSTFYASKENIACYEKSGRMATGYDDDGFPLPGRFAICPDLAGAGLWSTPKELLVIAREFLAARNGKSGFLQENSARMMAKPVEKFPWTGLGVFTGENDMLMTQGWGENGQCMMKMNCRTGQLAIVMTNRNPGMAQAESGVEWLVNQYML